MCYYRQNQNWTVLLSLLQRSQQQLYLLVPLVGESALKQAPVLLFYLPSILTFAVLVLDQAARPLPFLLPAGADHL